MKYVLLKVIKDNSFARIQTKRNTFDNKQEAIKYFKSFYPQMNNNGYLKSNDNQIIVTRAYSY